MASRPLETDKDQRMNASTSAVQEIIAYLVAATVISTEKSRSKLEMHHHNRHLASSDSIFESGHYAVTGLTYPSPPRSPPPLHCQMRMSEFNVSNGVPVRRQRWSVAGTPELRFKVDTMQADLERLQSKNQEMANKYQSVLRDYESALESRGRLEVVLNEHRDEGEGLRQKLENVLQEKHLISQQLIALRVKLDYKNDELADLRDRIRGDSNNVINGMNIGANSKGSNVWIDDVLKQWEDVRLENEARRLECERIVERMTVMNDHCLSLEKRLEMAEVERQSIGLKHKDEMVAIIEQLHKLVQERDLLRNRLDILARQLDDGRREVARLHGTRRRLDEKLSLMHEKYEAMHRDYDNTMRERSEVLEESNRMSEERERQNETINRLKSHSNALEEHNSALQAQNEQFRLEKDSPYYSVPLANLTNSESEIVDLTRRALEKEVNKYKREAEEAKAQNSKMLVKMNRILDERDSIRTVCDRLRRDRNEAVGNLAIPFKHGDQSKELKVSQWTAMGNRIHEAQTRRSPSNSKDSAIDNDMSEWEVETMHINLSASNTDLGIELRGGRDDPFVGNQVPIYVKSMSKGGKLDGHLRTYDYISQVNDIDVSNMEHRSVVDILRNSKHVKLVIISKYGLKHSVVKRRRLIGMKLISVPLDRTIDDDVGIDLENGVYIDRIRPGSSAARTDTLAIGDRLLYVNDVPVHEHDARQLMQLIDTVSNTNNSLVLAVMKSSLLPSPSTPSTSSFGEPKKMFEKQNQTMISNCDLGMVNKSRGTILDKVHDKFFRKSDKKPRIPAAAVESSAEKLKWSRTGSLRYSLRSSLRAPSTFSSSSHKNSLEPDLVLGQLDEMLEEEVAGPINRALSELDKDPTIGSTWPKLRNPPPVLPASSQLRKVRIRPSVIPVFASSLKPPPKNDDNTNNRIISTTTIDPSAIRSRPLTWYPPSEVYSVPSSCEYDRPTSVVNDNVPVYGQTQDVPAQLASPTLAPSRMLIAHARPVSFAPSSSPLKSSSRDLALPSPLLLRPPPYPGPRCSPTVDEPESSSLSRTSSISNTSSTRVKYLQAMKLMPSRISPFQSIDHQRRLRNTSQTDSCAGRPRQVVIEGDNNCESAIQLGIAVDSNSNGVFISSINDHGLAASKGVQIGDQLLDICGINMRSADKDSAQRILRQLCYSGRHERITMLLRYNPQLLEQSNNNNSSNNNSMKADSTPRATPDCVYATATSNRSSNVSRDYFVHLGGTPRNSREILSSINESNFYLSTEPRWVYNLCKSPNNNNNNNNNNNDKISTGLHTVSEWGFSLCGGNSVGIFVDKIDDNLVNDDENGLMVSDQILVFNGVNFRDLTLEQATFELERPVDADSPVNVLVQYSWQKYSRLKRGDGGDADSFYIRVNVDRPNENTDELDLHQGEILYVDNTLFMGAKGRWRAWHLDREGRQRQCGVIPSKYRLEEEFLQKRGGVDADASGFGDSSTACRRGPIRRSLKFIRRSARHSGHHSRTGSKESSSIDDVVLLVDDLYQRVQRLDCRRKRPVLIVGALTEPFVVRLVDDYPQVFAKCVPECPAIAAQQVEQGLQKGLFVDCRKRDKLFEVTTMAAVKDIIDKGYHCLLDVGPCALERLQNLCIYPIVVRIRFKTVKQVKELKEQDGDRIVGKQAKQLLDKAGQVDVQLAAINCQVITIVASQHCNPLHTVKVVCQQILSAVEMEQKKTLYILTTDNSLGAVGPPC